METLDVSSGPNIPGILLDLECLECEEALFSSCTEARYAAKLPLASVTSLAQSDFPVEMRTYIAKFRRGQFISGTMIPQIRASYSVHAAPDDDMA